jgi:hypothetical protein
VASALVFSKQVTLKTYDLDKYGRTIADVLLPDGTNVNLSLTGWRFPGDLPLRVGEVCSKTVNLSIDQQVYVTAGIVRGVHGEEYGLYQAGAGEVG